MLYFCWIVFGGLFLCVHNTLLTQAQPSSHPSSSAAADDPDDLSWIWRPRGAIDTLEAYTRSLEEGNPDNNSSWIWHPRGEINSLQDFRALPDPLPNWMIGDSRPQFGDVFASTYPLPVLEGEHTAESRLTTTWTSVATAPQQVTSSDTDKLDEEETESRLYRWTRVAATTTNSDTDSAQKPEKGPDSVAEGHAFDSLAKKKKKKRDPKTHSQGNPGEAHHHLPPLIHNQRWRPGEELPELLHNHRWQRVSTQTTIQGVRPPSLIHPNQLDVRSAESTSLPILFTQANVAAWENDHIAWEATLLAHFGVKTSMNRSFFRYDYGDLWILTRTPDEMRALEIGHLRHEIKRVKMFLRNPLRNSRGKGGNGTPCRHPLVLFYDIFLDALNTEALITILYSRTIEDLLADASFMSLLSGEQQAQLRDRAKESRHGK